MFTRGSRYEALAETSIPGPDGRTVRYKRIRFLPQPASADGGSVVVEENDRPDRIAYRAAQDAEGWWRIADANAVLRPAELSAEPGRRLKLPPRTGG